MATTADKFTKVKRKFTTTVGAGGIAVGGTTLPLSSTTGLPTDTPIVLTVNPGGTTEEVMKGVVSGLNLTSVSKGLNSTTDSAHSAGESVTMYWQEQNVNDMVDGLLAEHTQAGLHSKVNGNTVPAGTDTVALLNAAQQLTNTTFPDANQNPSILKDSSDRIANYVKSGTGVVAISSGLIGTFSDITYYILGKRYTKTGISNKTYTASKDTYVDIDTSGTVTYTEVANGAAAPALATNNIRVAKVVTSGSAITSVVQAPFSDGAGHTIGNTAPVAANAITNPYKFYVYRNAAWTPGSPSKIQFDTKLFDTGNNFDNTTNFRFTAPVAGFYWFSAAYNANMVGGNVMLVNLYKNGSSVLQGTEVIQGSTAGFGMTSVVTGLLQLAVGDYIEVFGNGGTTGATGSSLTYFQGFLVSAT